MFLAYLDQGRAESSFRGRGSNVKKGQFEGDKNIGQKIGYITILYFCKKSLIAIKPAFFWSKL